MLRKERWEIRFRKDAEKGEMGDEQEGEMSLRKDAEE